MATDGLKALRSLRKQAAVATARLRRRGEELIAEVLRRKARVSREFYEIGMALGELAQARMYVALGYGSFGELLDDRSLFQRMHAHRLVAVARAFTRDQALGLGAEKAYALTRYVAATPADELASALVDADAAIDGKRVSVISVRELAAAARAIRAEGRGGQRDPEERAARAAARAAQARFRRQGARGAVASAVRHEGAWVVRIDVPVAHVGRILGSRG
jgi:hypothetical protein